MVVVQHKTLSEDPLTLRTRAANTTQRPPNKVRSTASNNSYHAEITSEVKFLQDPLQFGLVQCGVPPSVAHLPLELFRVVLAFVSPELLLRVVARVCRLWRAMVPVLDVTALCPNIRENCVEKYEYVLRFLKEHRSTMPSLRRLRLDPLTRRAAIQLLSRLLCSEKRIVGTEFTQPPAPLFIQSLSLALHGGVELTRTGDALVWRVVRTRNFPVGATTTCGPRKRRRHRAARTWMQKHW